MVAGVLEAEAEEAVAGRAATMRLGQRLAATNPAAGAVIAAAAAAAAAVTEVAAAAGVAAAGGPDGLAVGVGGAKKNPGRLAALRRDAAVGSRQRHIQSDALPRAKRTTEPNGRGGRGGAELARQRDRRQRRRLRRQRRCSGGLARRLWLALLGDERQGRAWRRCRPLLAVAKGPRARRRIECTLLSIL